MSSIGVLAEGRSSTRTRTSGPSIGSWPLPRTANWLEIANCAQSEAELDALRRCVRRGCPFGNADWTARTSKQLGIESTLRARGRPKKEREDRK
jgi:putative transposase